MGDTFGWAGTYALIDLHFYLDWSEYSKFVSLNMFLMSEAGQRRRGIVLIYDAEIVALLALGRHYWNAPITYRNLETYQRVILPDL